MNFKIIGTIISLLLLSGCSSAPSTVDQAKDPTVIEDTIIEDSIEDSDKSAPEEEIADVIDEANLEDEPAGSELFSLSFIQETYADALVGEVTIVDCTLSQGEETECYQFSVNQTPDHQVGPWCPTNITDDASTGGIWPNDGETIDVDGAFIKNLAALYKDDKRQMYDEETGLVYASDLENCAAVAPGTQVGEAPTNICMACDPTFLPSLPTLTYTIPVNPTQADSPQSTNNVSAIGVAFNGVKFDINAPLEMIISDYVIAPFDDCGGHVNAENGYHYHEHSGCSKSIETDNHEALIGLALDGFGMYQQSETSDLDECNGHTTESEGYHYHIGEWGSNQVLGCYSGSYGCAADSDSECDASATAGGRGGAGGGSAGGPPGRN